MSKLTFNMSVSPFGNKKANYVKEVASLAMAHQTLRSINCTAVFAVSTYGTAPTKTGIPVTLCPFRLGSGLHVRAAYSPAPHLPS